MNAMFDILMAKSTQCHKFRHALINNKDKLLIEGTDDICCGCGNSGYFAETTDVAFFHDGNTLGVILMDIRDEILMEMSSKEPSDRAVPQVDDVTKSIEVTMLMHRPPVVTAI